MPVEQLGQGSSVVWLRIILLTLLVIGIVSAMLVSYVYIYLPFRSGVESIRSATVGTNHVEQHLQGLENDHLQFKIALKQQVQQTYDELRASRLNETADAQTTLDTNNAVDAKAPDCKMLQSITNDIQASVDDFKSVADAFVTGISSELQAVVDDLKDLPTEIQCGTLCFLYKVLDHGGDTTEWTAARTPSSFSCQYFTNCLTHDCSFGPVTSACP